MDKCTNFYNKISEYKRLAPAYLSPDFYDIVGNHGELHDGSCVTILLDLLTGFHSYGGLNLNGSAWLPPKFSAPRSAVVANRHLMRNKLKYAINMQSN